FGARLTTMSPTQSEKIFRPAILNAFDQGSVIDILFEFACEFLGYSMAKVLLDPKPCDRRAKVADLPREAIARGEGNIMNMETASDLPSIFQGSDILPVQYTDLFRRGSS